MGGGIDRWTKHPEYYLSDGSVSILLGNTLFKVHKSYFERESEVFRDFFASVAKEDPQAGSDERPFTLRNVTPDEMEQFLWVWYDREYSYQARSKEHWITILTLAKRWEFPKINQLAVREIEALELAPAERISLYNEHGIEGEGLISSYIKLCRSPKVTEADGRLIEMEALIKVLQAREEALRKAAELGHESPTSASLADDALREIVTPLLKKGLNPPSDGSSTGSGAQASDLNGERAHGTQRRTSTITLHEPQVPNRNTQQMNGVPSHSTNPIQTGSNTNEKVKEEPPTTKGKDEERLAKEAQEKLERDAAKQAEEKEERERAEKAKQEKVREEKEKAEKAKQEKVREEREKTEKAKQGREKTKQEKEKEKEKEKAEKAEKVKDKEQKVEQKPLGNSRPKAGGS